MIMKFLICAAAIIVFAGPATAQKMLKAEPPIGSVPEGKVVLIDDGTCGPGKIKKIVGGNVQKRVARQVTCIAR